MPDPISASNSLPIAIDEARSSQTPIAQPADPAETAPASSEAKAQQFQKALNDQQQITEMQIKYETTVFDPAQDIEINATFSQPAKAAQL